MGKEPTISPELGAQLVAKCKELGSRRKAAQALGIAWGTAQRYLAELPKNAAPAIVDPLAHGQRQLVQQAQVDLFSTREVLQRAFARVETLAGHMQQAVDQSGVAVLDTFSAKQIQAYVAVLRESRGLVKLSIDVLELLLEVEQIERFQRIVLEAIERAEPAIAAEIRQELQNSRSSQFLL